MGWVSQDPDPGAQFSPSSDLTWNTTMPVPLGLRAPCEMKDRKNGSTDFPRILYEVPFFFSFAGAGFKPLFH